MLSSYTVFGVFCERFYTFIAYTTTQCFINMEFNDNMSAFQKGPRLRSVGYYQTWINDSCYSTMLQTVFHAPERGCCVEFPPVLLTEGLYCYIWRSAIISFQIAGWSIWNKKDFLKPRSVYWRVFVHQGRDGKSRSLIRRNGQLSLLYLKSEHIT